MKKNLIILFSGPIAVGKSTVSQILVDQHGFEKILTSQYLKNLISFKREAPNRTELQDLGDKLDLQTNYMWVIDDVLIPAIKSKQKQCLWLFDSVRKPEQVENFKAKFNNEIIHIHFIASESLLKKRYIERQESLGCSDVSYEAAIGHHNEIISRGLASTADCVINVDGMHPEEIVKKITIQFTKDYYA